MLFPLVALNAALGDITAAMSRWLHSGFWTILLFFLCCASFRRTIVATAEEAGSCHNLRLGQYLCIDPKIDEVTQEPQNCRDACTWVECLPAPNVTCRLPNGTQFRFSGEEVGFNKTIPCRNVSGYSYKVAVALSLFLGWLGADRFYLGYPALGVLKFCTVGFCGIGTLVDFILIAVQIVGPADGSDYIVDYYGARLSRLAISEHTYRKPHLAP
ncbi:TM2 domain-containing protein 1 isoform X4 [Syngnathus typhle]|uniref:TM2 domain-containing protein 1 isoform X4 n=1 Tax=Syngnathus typhle TaxID=161592 RepID=UPI002A6B560A|nr:TM2 domain-containing protein 1 isoform X4 [Syngnathus typhle]